MTNGYLSLVMQITPQQLLAYRQQLKLSREAFAEMLGDTSASTVNKWERGINPIPLWVGEKIFSKLPLDFTLGELSELLDICRQLNLTLPALLKKAALEAIAKHKEKTTRNTNITYLSGHAPSSMVAEEPARYIDKTGTED